MIKYLPIALFILGCEEAIAMKLTSKDFQHEGMIPQLFTCEGKDISPELSWSETPDGVKSFALICDDPDAPMGTFDHWVLFNIPATTRGLPQAMATYPAGSTRGQNSAKNNVYKGPCPPTGIHRYYFKLYALDQTLALPEGSTKPQVEEAMRGHILAETQLMGKYQKVGKK